MNFLLLIIVSISIFQPILCMESAQHGCPDQLIKLARSEINLTLFQQPALAPRPENSVKFLQALAQLHREFQIPKKHFLPQGLKPIEPQEKINALEQITEQRKMFDREIHQQRHELRGSQTKISEQRIRLKNILKQHEEEYVSIKIKNKNLLDRIDPQQDSEKIKTITVLIAEKIEDGNYIPSRTGDSLESFEILYERHNIEKGKESELKKKLEGDCIRTNKDRQVTVLRNGFIGHYNQLTDTLEILLMDFSNPQSQWKIEKQKRKALHQKMSETFLTIQAIDKNIALIQSQAEERDKKITCLMLQEVELLSHPNTTF